MNPDVDQILLLSATQLATNIAPLVPAGYAQGQTSLLSLMLMMCAREYERAADVRASENADMRVLFRELVPTIDDTDLQEKIDAAAQTQDDSLAISALNAGNAELRRLLIALHSHVESKNDRGAQARIWELLRRSASRRLVRLG